MKLTLTIAALALSWPAATLAQTTPQTHELAWHPSGKTPAAIPQMRAKRVCTEAANHHRGAKGPVTPAIRCDNTSVASAEPQSVERGE